ncbi:hypothetical protein, partial [Streptomyces globisporus]|uniref:hypothetical protein n=1 Tax=Streptomyces globisporus TaxID=1908 RepID=UPI00131D9B81
MTTRCREVLGEEREEFGGDLGYVAVVEVDVTGSFDPVLPLGLVGLLDRFLGHPGGGGRFVAGDHQERSRGEQTDEVEGVEVHDLVDAGEGELVGLARVPAAVGAVVLPGFVGVAA